VEPEQVEVEVVQVVAGSQLLLAEVAR